jgi:hypothetical protein
VLAGTKGVSPVGRGSRAAATPGGMASVHRLHPAGPRPQAKAQRAHRGRCGARAQAASQVWICGWAEHKQGVPEGSGVANGSVSFEGTSVDRPSRRAPAAAATASRSAGEQCGQGAARRPASRQAASQAGACAARAAVPQSRTRWRPQRAGKLLSAKGRAWVEKEIFRQHAGNKNVWQCALCTTGPQG